MLNSSEIINKLYVTAAVFKEAVRAQDWYHAKYCYDTAVRVAVFCNVPNKIREEIFGIHGNPEEDVVEGLFADEWVLKAYEECIKADKTYQTMPPMRVPAAEENKK